MKSNRINKFCQNKSANGLTFVEVLVSIVVVALFAVLAISIFAKSRPRAARINCVSNLKQVGLAFRMWSNDHDAKFPWSVSTTNGGTLEFADRPDVFRHYLAVSNELTAPKVLKCPVDFKRTSATTWHQLTNDARHISYFVGLDADETRPQSILSGDRHITTNGVRAVGIVTIPRSSMVGWSGELHGGLGNIGMGDGSAHQWGGTGLGRQFANYRTNLAANSFRLVIP